MPSGGGQARRVLVWSDSVVFWILQIVLGLVLAMAGGMNVMQG